MKSASLAVSFVGAGALASGLACLLSRAGYEVREIVSRPEVASCRRAQSLARQVGARAVLMASANFDCDILWLAVPDSAIAAVASEVAARLNEDRASARVVGERKSMRPRLPIVLHPSGALASSALAAVAAVGAATASAHPMMTFVAGEAPSLEGAWFALEGHARATRAARQLAESLGARSFHIRAQSKALYHAFGAMLSPMLASELAAAEAVGLRAGISPREVRQVMQPIVQRTVQNVLARGAGKSFSGPLARGDVGTVASHLHALSGSPEADVYRALSSFATLALPVKRREEMQELLAGKGAEAGKVVATKSVATNVVATNIGGKEKPSRRGAKAR